MAIRKPIILSPDVKVYSHKGFDKVKILSDIPTPNFVENHAGYIPHSYKISGHSNIVLTRYKATSISGLDFDYFTVIDESTNSKFKASESLIRQVAANLDNSIKMNSECGFRGSFGSLSDTDVSMVANLIRNYYSVWRYFPNETSYDMVLEYHQSLNKIQRMKNEESGCLIKTRIDEARAEMKKLRELIEEYEKDENQIYEEAADAMNLLEEKGYDAEKLINEKNAIVAGYLGDDLGWNDLISVNGSYVPLTNSSYTNYDWLDHDSDYMIKKTNTLIEHAISGS